MLDEKSREARQITYLYSFLFHMLLSKTKLTAASAALILPENSGKVIAKCGMYTASIYPPKKK
jgi:hypothetical protein